MPVEPFNQALFLLINAGVNPNSFIVAIAKCMAALPMWLIPGLLILGWLRGDNAIRRILLGAAMTAGLALLVNQGIGLFWQHPRPFMIGLGHTLIPHAADSSFPSDHMTLICGVAFGLLAHPAFRKTGIILLGLSMQVAWARIYLGVHFPLDMAGALFVTSLCAWGIHRQYNLIVAPVFKPMLISYEWLLAPVIKRGWLR